MTECIPTAFGFQDLGSREVVAAFDGGKVSSDAGGLLLREVEDKFRFLEQFARCFTDYRDADLVEHPLLDLDQAASLRHLPGLRGSQRPRSTAPRPAAGRPVGKTDPAGDERAALSRQGQSLGRQEHAQPPRTHRQSATTRTAATRRSSLIWQDRKLSRRCLRAAASGRRRSASSSTSMPPTIRFTAINWAGSFTVTTTAIVICRCTSSAAIIRCALPCGRATSTPRPAPWCTFSGSWRASEKSGPACRSCCAATAVFAATI